MHQIGPAFHCYRVKLVGQEGFGVIHSGRFVPVWIQDAVGFHRADEETALFLTGMQNVWVGVPAVHKEVSPGLTRYGFDDIHGHVDLCGAFFVVAFERITQGSVSGTDDCGMNLITIDHLPLQMGVVPVGSLCGPLRFGGRPSLRYNRIVNADEDAYTGPAAPSARNFSPTLPEGSPTPRK